MTNPNGSVRTAPAPQQERTLFPKIAGALIVVIDDEDMVLIGYRMLFESWGYRVLAASSGEEAGRMLRLHPYPPDMIVADFRLKGGHTGLEAIHDIQDRYGEKIPAILITGDTAVDRLREAAASGFPVLHKPVNGTKLKSLLASSLGLDE